MTVTRMLAERSTRALEPEADAYLRVLTLTNVAAGLGELGRPGRLVAGLPFDERRPADAAFLNAMQLHARTQDDFHPGGRCHVGIAALAPTLALADRAGERTLQCLAAGYEVMCAAASAYSTVAQRRGYRPTGMFGPLGAAAAAAVALGLDVDGVANAVGLASAMSAGTNQSWVSGTDEWLLELGAAARAGVDAALLTEGGAVASPVAMEGPAGWARAFFDDPGATSLIEALQTPKSRIVEVATKLHPVSGIAQVVTQLGCDLHDLVGTQVPQEVLVTMSEAEMAYPGSANRGPFRSRSDALMSVAFCVACALTDGIVALERLENPNEPALGDLIDRVKIAPSASMPESAASVRVSVRDVVHEVSGQASSLLFPAWDQVESPALARRSEAPPEAVVRARALLGAETVQAGALAELLVRARHSL